MKYEQVETNKRRPLPFVIPPVRAALLADAGRWRASFPRSRPRAARTFSPRPATPSPPSPRWRSTAPRHRGSAASPRASPRRGRAGRRDHPRTRSSRPPSTIACSRPEPRRSSPARSISPSGWSGGRRSATPRTPAAGRADAHAIQVATELAVPDMLRRVPAAARDRPTRRWSRAAPRRSPGPAEDRSRRWRAGERSLTASTGSPRSPSRW